MLLPFPSNAYANMGWMHWQWFFWNSFFCNCSSFFFVAVSFVIVAVSFIETISYWNNFLFVAVCFIEPVIFVFTVAVILFLTKSEKNRKAVFIIIIRSLYKESLLYPMFRGKKILCFAEKLLEHPVFRGKTEMSLVFRRK